MCSSACPTTLASSLQCDEEPSALLSLLFYLLAAVLMTQSSPVLQSRGSIAKILSNSLQNHSFSKKKKKRNLARGDSHTLVDRRWNVCAGAFAGTGAYRLNRAYLLHATTFFPGISKERLQPRSLAPISLEIKMHPPFRLSSAGILLGKVVALKSNEGRNVSRLTDVDQIILSVRRKWNGRRISAHWCSSSSSVILMFSQPWRFIWCHCDIEEGVK